MAGGILSPLTTLLFGEDDPRPNFGPMPSLQQGAYRYPSDNPEVQRLENMGYDTGTAPTISPQKETWAQVQERTQGLQNQQQLIDALKSAASGTGGPSAAQAQLDYANSQAMQDQMSLAASARGGPLAQMAAQRAAQQNIERLQSQEGYQSAILRAQEQQGARSQLMDAVKNQRIMTLQTQGMSLQQAIAQAELEARQNQLNLQGKLGYLGASQSAAQNMQQGAIQYQQGQAGLAMQGRNAEQAAYDAAQNRNTQKTGALLGGLGALTQGIVSAGAGGAASAAAGAAGGVGLAQAMNGPGNAGLGASSNGLPIVNKGWNPAGVTSGKKDWGYG